MPPASSSEAAADRSTGQRATDDFDAFYKQSRDRLLLQTWALTGDFAAARSAVRHTFVVAWHQWRKVSRHEDPESWARPQAWAYAQHRHTARLGHRDKDLDPEVKATLDALGKLPPAQRRVLLLSQLSTVSLDEMAREVGLLRADAERELQTATAQFSVLRDVASTDIGGLLEPMAATVAETRWPRGSIVRRSGAARRRTHAVVAAAATVAALVVSGMLVTDATGVRPTLDREPVSTRQAAVVDDEDRPEPDPQPPLVPDALLTAGQVASSVKGNSWTVTRTDGNTEGDGRALPCQAERYADPRGTAALLRTFAASRTGGPRRTVGQLAESSRSDRAARRTYQRSVGWYAACDEARVQLLSTRRIGGIGNQAVLLALRSWQRPVRTTVVGVARTGRITTTTTLRVTGDARPDVRGATRLLNRAVSGLCTLPDGGACTGEPTPALARPFPIGDAPSLLQEIDLPPVRGVSEPWTGSPTVRANENPAATPCDRTSFRGGGISRNVTRTFVILDAGLPPAFGLSETTGALPRRKAASFVDGVRNRLARCADDDLTTEVRRLAHTDTRREDLTVWSVSTELSDAMTVRYLMAIVRTGTAVAQVGFVPAGARTMSDRDFIGVARRALERLHEHPAP